MKECAWAAVVLLASVALQVALGIWRDRRLTRARSIIVRDTAGRSLPGFTRERRGALLRIEDT